MRRLIEENVRHGSPLTVRELSLQAQRLRARAKDLAYCPDEAENYVGRVVTVSHTGEVSSWSPELASGVVGDVARFSLGNVFAVESLDALLDSAKARNIQREIDAGIDNCSRSCDYFGVCGGGLPSNKFYENGAFNSTETLRCRLQIQALTEVLVEAAQPPAEMQ
jgi:uncharacterized protein